MFASVKGFQLNAYFLTEQMFTHMKGQIAEKTADDASEFKYPLAEDKAMYFLHMFAYVCMDKAEGGGWWRLLLCKFLVPNLKTNVLLIAKLLNTFGEKAMC